MYPSIDQSLLLGAARTAQLEAYQRATGARLVRFGTASDFFGGYLRGHGVQPLMNNTIFGSTVHAAPQYLCGVAVLAVLLLSCKSCPHPINMPWCNTHGVWRCWYVGVPQGTCGSGPAPMVFAATAPLGISGIKSTARLEADLLYR
jgi:hypothetical protein